MKVRGEKGVLTGTPFFFQKLHADKLRSRVRWAIRVGAIIVAAVFILVREFEIGFGQAKSSEESIAG
ncbi:MAG: hypothetical protein WA350_15945, partial [Candidatus Sulfotelmatobacter sp.]